jgi:flagellar basal-body rod protein FlgG
MDKGVIYRYKDLLPVTPKTPVFSMGEGDTPLIRGKRLETEIGELKYQLGLIETGSADPVKLGQIELARFVNPAGLRAIGNNLLIETSASGQPITGQAGAPGFGETLQGSLEASNVDVVEEMVSMIAAQRAYEINSKTVKTVEDMLSMANNLKR